MQFVPSFLSPHTVTYQQLIFPTYTPVLTYFSHKNKFLATDLVKDIPKATKLLLPFELIYYKLSAMQNLFLEMCSYVNKHVFLALINHRPLKGTNK